MEAEGTLGWDCRKRLPALLSFFCLLCCFLPTEGHMPPSHKDKK